MTILPQYTYTVVDSTGRTLKGSMEADNEDTCRKLIAQRGLYCVNVSQPSIGSRSISIGPRRFNVKDLSLFCRQLATMLSAGTSVVKSLDVIFNQTVNKTEKEIIKNVYESVQKGQALSAAFSAEKGVFPDFMISMLQAGESSGNIDGVMNEIANHYEKEVKINAKVKGAMTYPIILLCVTICVVIVMMAFVVPKFTVSFTESGTKLPGATRALIAISNSFTHFWYVYIIVVVGIIVGFKVLMKNPNRRLGWDKFKTKIPIFGKLNRTVIAARFSRTLSTLMHSGIPMLKSLEIAGKVLGNKFYEKGVENIGEDIKKGMSLSGAIKKSALFPLMLMSMISIGEEAGTLDEILVRTAAFYDDESDRAISKMVSLLEPIMIMVMAGIVGFIVVALISAMYGSMGNYSNIS